MNPTPFPGAVASSPAGGADDAKAPPSHWRRKLPLVVLFVLALLLHLRLATLNWNAGFLVGHEFRQTHTAIIAFYIDQENRFSLHYTTPLFGKPWSVPMEFPLYEWSVVIVSRAAGLPLYEAARTVSLACFYLTLPGLYLLLGCAGMAPVRRLLVLTLTLVCPAYIFYSRAFLMESMVLMCSVWFLAAFVRALRDQKLAWAVLCAAAGAGAGLIKSTTFFVWLFPAALYGAWRLWGAIRAGSGWSVVGRTLAWGVGTAVIPCLATIWWVKYTDALKIHHPSGHIFASRELTDGSFGLYGLAYRFDPGIWRHLLANWREAIMWPWLIAGVVVLGAVCLRRQRWPILGATGLFLFPQFLFPMAYALQDYYFYACAVFLLVAVGYVLTGVLESRLPAWSRWLIVGIPLAAMLAAYRTDYYRGQIVWSNGGWGFTDALRVYIPEDSVIVVSGADWAPLIPYYSQRKALMIRSGLEKNAAYQERAFSDLDNELVGALIMVGEERNNQALIQRAVEHFALDKSPTFSTPVADIYVSDFYQENAIRQLTTFHGFDQVTRRPGAARPALADGLPANLTRGLAIRMFPMVSPLPIRSRVSFGYSYQTSASPHGIAFHPDSDLWVPAPPGASQIEWIYGVRPGAYERAGDKTDGVEFIIEGEAADGTRRRLFDRILDPAATPGDRGPQHLVLPYQPRPGEVLVFSSRPNRAAAYDWAYVARIAVTPVR